MTPVSTLVTIRIHRDLGIPPAARIAAGPSRRAVDFDLGVAATFVPEQQFPAPVLQPLASDDIPGHGQKERQRDQHDQPFVRRHTVFLSSGASHV
ncbi:MAG: hypothetical protein U1E06_23590 [Tabrizicola sp.]|uniref:hypothetical protein n=1 Tax=Tabrizicola sp. TaxID=2005166 RepID=UPI0027332BBC|nr:hypothetical protein [Tabrizicola sp.]MDP3263951.1 hypothetical protein [Tabrizicola sp.]MDP3647316.1 hypothetical protein [Paracoccaceae bacterium]MDZ4069784.1 hypothetical protein [Tabrizicola sp.]MDZ4303941.1 hypothetical protein [Pseudomonas sp.]